MINSVERKQLVKFTFLFAVVIVLAVDLRYASAGETEPALIAACSETQLACRRACIPLDENGDPDYSDLEALDSCIDTCDDVAFDCVVEALGSP
jgi:hypothetical protein